MLVLPEGFITANDYFKSAISFLERYEWLYNWPVTEVLSSGVLAKMPVEWWPALRYLTNEELNKLPRGYFKQSWPQSLKEFVRECAALRLPVADEELPVLDQGSFLLEVPSRALKAKENILRHFLRKGLTPKKRHEVTYLAALVHQKCQQAGVQSVVDMGCGHGYLCEVLHHCYGYSVIGMEAVPSRVIEAQKRHRNICMNLGIEDTSGVTYMTCDVSADTPGPIVEALNRAGHTKPFCLVGLHSCGDLTPSAIKLFLHIDTLRVMVLVSCCYHTMRQTDEDEQQVGEGQLFQTSSHHTPCSQCDMSTLLHSNLNIYSSQDGDLIREESQRIATTDPDDKKRKAFPFPVKHENHYCASNIPDKTDPKGIMNTIAFSKEELSNHSYKRLKVAEPCIASSVLRPRASSCCDSYSPKHKHIVEKEQKIKLALMWAAEQNSTRVLAPVKHRVPMKDIFQGCFPFPVKMAKSCVQELRKYGSEPSLPNLLMNNGDILWPTSLEERLSKECGNFSSDELIKEIMSLEQWMRILLSCKVSHDAEHFSSFPLSRELQVLMHKGCMASRNRRLCAGPCVFLRRPFLRLAAQESLERWELMSPKLHRQHCVHVLARAVFHLYTMECGVRIQKSNRRCIRRSKLPGSPDEIIGELVDHMMPSNFSAVEVVQHKVNLMKLYEVLEPLGTLMEAVTGLQTALHMTCEGLILVDRIMALGMPNATIVKTADQRQTPRCYAMVAVK